jgi:hypothetical protein
MWTPVSRLLGACDPIVEFLALNGDMRAQDGRRSLGIAKYRRRDDPALSGH